VEEILLRELEAGNGEHLGEAKWEEVGEVVAKILVLL